MPAKDPTIRNFSFALAAEGKKPKTIRTYTDAAAWLQRSQSVEDWSEIRKSHVRAHMALILEGHSPAYASNQFRALQQFFKFLESGEDIRNPMTGMRPPAVPEKLVPVISDGEYARLIQACSGRRLTDLRDRAVFEFFRATGARRSEVAGLRVTDVDLDQLAAIVTGKASRMRIVRVDAATGLAISRYLRARKGHRHASSDMLWLGATAR